MLRLDMAGLSDRGLRRKRNEDAFVASLDSRFGVVCDGVGGNVGGDLAAQLAVSTLSAKLAQFSKAEAEHRSFLEQAIRQTSFRVYKYGVDNPEFQGLGTTLNCLWFTADRVFIGNVGDSRSYLFYQKQLWQLTVDHNIETLVSRGTIAKEFANLASPRSLASVIGSLDPETIDIYSLDLTGSQIFISATDGLFTMLSAAEICDILSGAHEDLNDLCRHLVDKANSKGGRDNTTVVITRVCG